MKLVCRPCLSSGISSPTILCLFLVLTKLSNICIIPSLGIPLAASGTRSTVKHLQTSKDTAIRHSLSPIHNAHYMAQVSQHRFSTRLPTLAPHSPVIRSPKTQNLIFTSNQDGNEGDASIREIREATDDEDDVELGEWIDGETLVAIGGIEDTR